MKRYALAFLLLLVAALVVAARGLERFVNRVEPVPLPVPSAEALALHRSSLVADMHADTLLWGRDLLAPSAVGHVDLPRLQEGGVGLQFFTVVSRVPYGFNIDRTDGDAPDLLTLVGWAQLSPLGWRRPFERALGQAERLRRAISASRGKLLPVRTWEDLEDLLRLRRKDPGVVGALLGLEGAHALERGPEQLAPLFAAGVRMIGLAHFFDNDYAGSAHGLIKGGLTERGRALVRRMEARGVLIDLAHASAATIEDVLAVATRPTVVSHGGVRGTCDNNRNLSDSQIRAIARGGGVIGIGFWDTAVCGRTPRHIVEAIRYVVARVGDEHVALGSDFDGGIRPGFDVTGVPALTQEMMRAGMDEAAVRNVLGRNVLRVLRATLPSRADERGAQGGEGAARARDAGRPGAPGASLENFREPA
ncbi:MAG: dipeptidase [Myxococcota bacterium]